MTPEATGMGAYGLCVDGLPERWLAACPASWPSVSVGLHTSADETGSGWFDAQRAVLRLSGGVSATIAREGGRIELSSARPLPPDGLAHPFLAQPAAVVNWWLGRDAVHAGAVVSDGRGWGVLGERGCGKSFLLAELWRRGMAVLSDDLLVVDELRGEVVAYAGPRLIDLRADAADLYPQGYDLGVIGSRPRWRLGVGVAPLCVPLAGWIVLDWAEQISIEPTALCDRPALWENRRGVGLPPTSPARLLALATLPMLRYHRPRHRHRAAEGADRLVAALTSLRV